jgi:hypothetical protein
MDDKLERTSLCNMFFSRRDTVKLDSSGRKYPKNEKYENKETSNGSDDSFHRWSHSREHP